MVAEELLDWQLACDRFAREGDVRGMRACAQEVRAIGGAEAAREAQAMEADAALYAGDGGAAGRRGTEGLGGGDGNHSLLLNPRDDCGNS